MSIKLLLKYIFLVLITSSCSSHIQSKKIDNYLYKVSVEVNSGERTYTDKLISLDIDFKDKLKECGEQDKKVDYNSIRIYEKDLQGNIIDTCIAQYDINKLLWLAQGVTPKSTTRYYDICFNTTDQKEVTAKQKSLIHLQEMPAHWAFTTPNGYFVYEKKGGAFNVFAPEACNDNESGKDWVRGDYKEYNGILNIGDPSTKAIFHPHNDVEADDGDWRGCKSDLVIQGPLHYRIRSMNKFGNLPGDARSNTLYKIYFDIYPNHIQATITDGNGNGYASVMEMTPGGDSLEASDYVIGSNGHKYMKGDTLAMDVSPEWFFANDVEDKSNLFFIHKQDDSVTDGVHWYDFMQGLMIGYGRGANAGINTYPNEFYMGFSNTKNYTEMQELVASISNNPTIVVHKTKKQDIHRWGKIEIRKIDSNLTVVLENSKLKCTYSPVMTANLETAITSMIVKKNGMDISGKHLNEMAKGHEEDRGVLSSKTGIVFENENRKTIHMEWNNGKSIEEVTLFKDKPYIRIDYQKMFINICDMGNADLFKDGQYQIYGAEEWSKKRAQLLKDNMVKLDSNPHTALTSAIYPNYPNPMLGDWGVAPKDNPMNYKGWYILSVYSPSKGVGYGRVVPADVVNHFKLLNTNGFEQFPFWFEPGTFKPFTEYLYVFTDKSKSIDLGKEIVDEANASKWYTIDSAYRSIGNSFIEAGYGEDNITEGNRLTGISLFRDKQNNNNMAIDLDAYGYDYATYFKGGPTTYHITHIGDDYIEATVTFIKEGGVNVVKKERIYKDMPVLEIEYEKLDIKWWEDFYSLENEDNRMYAIWGINREITPKLQAGYRADAEKTCGHNFGDCFLKAAGSSVENSAYKGYFIFGYYDKDTKSGMGFVIPTAIGLHDGLKLWSMHNYESFPFYNLKKELPMKRWLFSVSNGQQGIFDMGKKIVDQFK